MVKISKDLQIDNTGFTINDTVKEIAQTISLSSVNLPADKWQRMTMNDNSYGNYKNFTVDSNGITIKKGISQVKISYTIRFDYDSQDTDNVVQSMIRKGDGSYIWATHLAQRTFGSQAFTSHSGLIVNCKEGDRFELWEWAAKEYHNSRTGVLIVEKVK